MTEKIVQAAETKIWDKLRPWKAIFTLLTVAFGMYGVDNINALFLYAMLLVTLAYIMKMSNKHEEVLKKIVIPFVVDEALSILDKYIKPVLPEPVIVEKIVERIVEVPVEKIVEKIIYVPMTDAEYNITSDSTE